MSIQLVINGTTYNFPSSGQDPNWAESLIAWAEAVTDSLSVVAGEGDIAESSASIANNTSGDVTGLSFAGTSVKAAIVNYQIYVDSGPANSGETGTILLAYNDSTSQWDMAQDRVGNLGVVLTINASGQVQFTSSDLGDPSYTRRIVFTARALNRI